MPASTSSEHGAQRFSALTASALATAAGGAMDAWVFLAHGVFATAQSGNVVLFGIALAGGHLSRAATHLPSLLAFIAGLVASRWAGELIKRSGANSRNLRLGAECLMLVTLALVATRLPGRVVTACVGFIAAVQITSLSRIGSWSFNTGMMTGNLRCERDRARQGDDRLERGVAARRRDDCLMRRLRCRSDARGLADASGRARDARGRRRADRARDRCRPPGSGPDSGLEPVGLTEASVRAAGALA